MKRFANHSDEQLIALYATGCNEAFDALLMRYDAYIHSYIRYSVTDEDLVEDIFQETFIKVMTTIKSGKYTESQRFKQWLTRITHNLVMDFFRRAKIQQGRLQPFFDEDEADAAYRGIASDELNGEEAIIEADQLGELYNKLKLLPLEQRQVVQMRYWEDMSFKEIAELTGVSINTALGRMRYALINLRKHMTTA